MPGKTIPLMGSAYDPLFMRMALCEHHDAKVDQLFGSIVLLLRKKLLYLCANKKRK
jgi:hypothetical protein